MGDCCLQELLFHSPSLSDLPCSWCPSRCQCRGLQGLNVPSVPQVALLCGPPGLGKTTLAHVIAKHAGYNVVEMNAR